MVSAFSAAVNWIRSWARECSSFCLRRADRCFMRVSKVPSPRTMESSFFLAGETTRRFGCSCWSCSSSCFCCVDEEDDDEGSLSVVVVVMSLRVIAAEGLVMLLGVVVVVEVSAAEKDDVVLDSSW